MAESFLLARGLKTLHRNFQVRSGEIDLVMLDDEILVFTEVRYRGNSGHGSGAESVTWTKQRRIVSAARQFLDRHAQHARRPCRFDVVSIGGGADGAELNWIRSAFDAG